MPQRERAMSHRSFSVYIGITWFLWLTLLATLLWAANKSITLVDEGYMLLSYKYPGETLNSTTHFALIVYRLFGWLHPGVVTFRILRLLLDAGSVCVFAVGLSRWLASGAPAARRPWTRLSILLPFVAIGDLYGYAYFGQTLSYNTLNNTILLLCYGLLLMTFAGRQEMSMLRGFAYVLAGALAGFGFFIKFPSSITLICACIITAAAISRDLSWRERAYRILLLAGGYAAGMMVFFLLFLSFATWIVNFRLGLATTSTVSHSADRLLAFGVKNMALLLGTVALQVVVSALLFYLLSGMARTGRRAIAGVLVPTGTLLLSGAMAVVALRESMNGYVGNWGDILGFATIIGFGVGLLASYVVTHRLDLVGLIRRHCQLIGITLFLLAGPFIGAIGTTQAILAGASGYMACWVAVIAVLLLVMPRLGWNRSILPFLWSVPMLLVVTEIAQGVVLHPFEVPRSLFTQTEVLAQSGDLEGLQVDRDTYRFFQSVRHLITDNSRFQPGDPVLAAYNVPGLVYVIGGVSPGAPWYFADEPERNCSALRSTQLRDLGRSIVIVKPEISPSFRSCLRSVGVVFPGHYRLVGAVTSPYDNELIKVYVPLDRTALPQVNRTS